MSNFYLYRSRQIPPRVQEIAQQIMNTSAEISQNITNSTTVSAVNASSMAVGKANSTTRQFTTFGNDTDTATLLREDENREDESQQFHRPQHHVKWSQHRDGNKRWSDKRHGKNQPHKTVIKLNIPIYVGRGLESDSSSSSDSSSNSVSSQEDFPQGSADSSVQIPADDKTPSINPEVNTTSVASEPSANSSATAADVKIPDTVTTTNSSVTNVTDLLLVAPPTNDIIPAESDPITAMMPVEGVDIIPETMATVDNSTTTSAPPKTTTAAATTTTLDPEFVYHFGTRNSKRNS